MSAPASGLAIVVREKEVEASLWRRLRFDNEIICRESLFNRYRKFALSLARKQFHRRPEYGLDILDFEQFAYTGLLEAIDRFNPLKNIPFEAFAKFRIIGSISDGISRSSEGAAQYSHRRRVETERLRSMGLSAKHQTSDPIAELSELAVGLAIGFILEGADVSLYGEKVEPGPSAYETLSWREMQLSLTAEIENLPQSEKTVIQQHYINGVAFKEIAILLKVSAGRVSQIHKVALNKLRRKLGSYN